MPPLDERGMREDSSFPISTILDRFRSALYLVTKFSAATAATRLPARASRPIGWLILDALRR
jgi:hypothetical protein